TGSVRSCPSPITSVTWQPLVKINQLSRTAAWFHVGSPLPARRAKPGSRGPGGRPLRAGKAPNEPGFCTAPLRFPRVWEVLSPPYRGPGVVPRTKHSSDIQEPHVLGVAGDKGPSGFNVFPHKHAEQLVCLRGVVQCHLEQHAPRRVHRGVPELIG